MNKAYQLALHIFRRDLRLHDNTALIAALNAAEKVLPCFIFDKRQIERNAFKSDNCIQFMVNSLIELNLALQKKKSHLYVFYGHAEKVVDHLAGELPIEAVYINRDYTPFSIMRDNAIASVCKKNKIKFHCHADLLLHEPEDILKNNHKPYTIFTPFMHKAKELLVEKPQNNRHDNFYSKKINIVDHVILDKLSHYHNPNLLVTGGRSEALRLLKQIDKLTDYKNTRNYPAIKNGTTKLSAHNKFGTLSIREFYAKIKETFGPSHPLINELYWRDFFTHIGFHFPRVFGNAFYDRFTNIVWSKNEKHFRAWCEGTTGFPIVDAGMRELNTTGYMHNRVRMIVASFLTKDLHIDWQWGEKYFAQKLTDYDPAVNNGNWQWAASTGCDAQPYFRIFNPWLQQQKYDAECLYIKHWIPELAHMAIKAIHNPTKYIPTLSKNYPAPIVDHALQSQKAKLMYKNKKVRSPILSD